MKTIEWVQQCKKCRGTGLYVGMAEGDGFAVVCHSCDGTGKQEEKVEYEPFTERKERSDVRWVVQTNPGISLHVGGENKLGYTDFGGQHYSSWAAGNPFKHGMEMRQFTCPAWWYHVVDYKKKPEWDECNLNLGRPFYACKHFDQKGRCWKRLDREFLP